MENSNIPILPNLPTDAETHLVIDTLELLGNSAKS